MFQATPCNLDSHAVKAKNSEDGGSARKAAINSPFRRRLVFCCHLFLLICQMFFQIEMGCKLEKNNMKQHINNFETSKLQMFVCVVTARLVMDQSHWATRQLVAPPAWWPSDFQRPHFPIKQQTSFNAKHLKTQSITTLRRNMVQLSFVFRLISDGSWNILKKTFRIAVLCLRNSSARHEARLEPCWHGKKTLPAVDSCRAKAYLDVIGAFDVFWCSSMFFDAFCWLFDNFWLSFHVLDDSNRWFESFLNY